MRETCADKAQRKLKPTTYYIIYARGIFFQKCAAIFLIFFKTELFTMILSLDTRCFLYILCFFFHKERTLYPSHGLLLLLLMMLLLRHVVVSDGVAGRTSSSSQHFLSGRTVRSSTRLGRIREGQSRGIDDAIASY